MLFTKHTRSVLVSREVESRMITHQSLLLSSYNINLEFHQSRDSWTSL